MLYKEVALYKRERGDGVDPCIHRWYDIDITPILELFHLEKIAGQISTEYTFYNNDDFWIICYENE